MERQRRQAMFSLTARNGREAGISDQSSERQLLLFWPPRRNRVACDSTQQSSRDGQSDSCGYGAPPIFQPFAALVLWKHYAGSRLISSGVRKDIWIAFGVTIVGGLFLAYFTYWFLSLIRDRKSTDSLMNLHGSATWAKREDIEKLGLA